MSMTVISLIVAAVVVLLLVVGGGIILLVVKRGKTKTAAPPVPPVESAFAPAGNPMQPGGWEPQGAAPAPAWGTPEAPPPVAAAPAVPVPPVAPSPAWEPAPEPAPAAVAPPEVPSPMPVPARAPDPLAATLSPDSYTTTPNVNAVGTVPADPYLTTPGVPSPPAGNVVPAKLRAHDGSVIQLARIVMRVGRHPECDIVVPTPGTSRNHAELNCQNGAWVITDLNSGNGTFVNGVRIHTHQLASGDEVRVDQTKFWFTTGA